jgi:hypothetical protein
MVADAADEVCVYAEAMSAQQTIALHTELQRP